MKVSELIEKLSNLPTKAMNQEIYLAPSLDTLDILPKIIIEPITEACDDSTVIGYVLTGQEYDN